MRIFIILLLFSFSIAEMYLSVSTKKSNPVDRETKRTFPFIVDAPEERTVFKENFEMTTAQYSFLYLGPWKDTIAYDFEVNDRLRSYSFELSIFSELRNSSTSQLLVQIDTTQIIKIKTSKATDIALYYHAYPVMVKNTTKDSIVIGTAGNLNAVLEALDSNQKWRPLELKQRYICGVGLTNVVLPPNYIGITAVAVPHGSWPTTLRLKLDSTISNEIQGAI